MQAPVEIALAQLLGAGTTITPEAVKGLDAEESKPTVPAMVAPEVALRSYDASSRRCGHDRDDDPDGLGARVAPVLLRALKLKLATIARHAEEVAHKGEQEGWSFGQYLHHLMALEIEERRQQRYRAQHPRLRAAFGEDACHARPQPTACVCPRDALAACGEIQKVSKIEHLQDR